MRNGDRWFMGDFEQAEGNAIPARLREEGSRSFRKHLVTKRFVSNVLVAWRCGRVEQLRATRTFGDRCLALLQFRRVVVLVRKDPGFGETPHVDWCDSRRGHSASPGRQ